MIVQAREDKDCNLVNLVNEILPVKYPLISFDVDSEDICFISVLPTSDYPKPSRAEDSDVNGLQVYIKPEIESIVELPLKINEDGTLKAKTRLESYELIFSRKFKDFFRYDSRPIYSQNLLRIRLLMNKDLTINSFPNISPNWAFDPRKWSTRSPKTLYQEYIAESFEKNKDLFTERISRLIRSYANSPNNPRIDAHYLKDISNLFKNYRILNSKR